MKKISKIIIVICLLALFIIMSHVISFADEDKAIINFVAIDSNTKKAVSGINIKVYQIGYKNSDGIFQYGKGFENSNILVDDQSEENVNIVKQYAEKNAKAIYEKTTDVNGEIRLTDLVPGSYLFVKSQGLNEYKMQSLIVIVPEVENDGTIKYNTTVKPKIEMLKETKKNTQKQTTSKSSTVVNEKTLPYTGTLNWVIPILSIAGIIIFSIGWLVFFTNSKKKLTN